MTLAMEVAAPTVRRPNQLLLAIAYIGFISLGLPDAVIGVAWPSVRERFELQNETLGIIFLISGTGYFLSSALTGRLLKTLSIGALLAGSSLLVALSGFGYAAAPVWLFMLGCAIFYGLGSGAIDAGLNNYAAHHFSARQMNWLHACYMLGATLGPMIMTAGLAISGSWRLGYAVIGSMLLTLSLLFVVTRRQWGRAESDNAAAENFNQPVAATLRLPTVWLQMILFFFYTGLEVTIGQWTFTLLTETRQIRPEIAGLYVTAYWASLGVGRVLFGLIVDNVPIDLLLRVCTIAAVLGCVLFVVPAGGLLPLFALMIVGLALAPVYPCLMTRTPQRLGVGHTAHAIGFQVSAAMIGAALLPALVGVIAGERRLGWIATCALVMSLVVATLHEALLLRSLNHQSMAETEQGAALTPRSGVDTPNVSRDSPP